uniref:Ixodegrin B n=1 Tax=Rhipicephalus appendiculatus TaxID=34631 RepID=A0A131Z489_RHIAP
MRSESGRCFYHAIRNILNGRNETRVILYENSCNQHIQCKWGECCRKKHNRTRCHRRPRYGGRCTNTSFRGIYKGYCDCFVSQGTCVNNRCI